MSNISIRYKASKTGAKFHASNKVVRGIRGPVGNGKSVTCINELHRLAKLQAPNSQGIRKTRWIIVRNTSIELRNTTLKTFQQWVPECICRIVHHPQIEGRMNYQLKDGTTVEAGFIFLAMDKPDDVKKVLSFEVTGGFINEAKEIPYQVVSAMRERMGRYPGEVDGYTDTNDYTAPRGEDGEYQPVTRKSLLMDTNPPDDDHWWYQLAEENKLREDKGSNAVSETKRIFDFFYGAPALIKDGDDYKPNPDAENIKHLPGGYQYYLDMIAGNTEEHINVMVLGNYGTIIEGRKVYTQYNDQIHCSKNPLSVIENLPVGLGWDFGLTPCVVFGQLTPTGQFRVFYELETERMGIREFARDVVKPWMNMNLKGIEIAFSYGDPSGVAGKETYNHSAIGILNDMHINNDQGMIIEPLNMGFVTEAAPIPGNNIEQRIDGVSGFMTKLVDSGEPGYLLSKSCKTLRKGKLGGYHYKKVKTSGSQNFKEKPDKNKYSHLSDAEQYLAKGFTSGITYVDHSQYEYDEDEQISRVESSMGY